MNRTAFDVVRETTRSEDADSRRSNRLAKAKDLKHRIADAIARKK